MRRSLLILILTVPAAIAQEKPSLPLPTSGNVTLPLDEYNRLMELASKPAKRPDASPLPYAIQSADLKLEIGGESAAAAIQFEGEVFSKSPIKVPLIAGMTLLSAQQTGKDLPLQQEGGAYTAFLSGPAAFSITLDARLPVNVEAGRASIRLPALSAGAVRLTLVIPGDHTNVNISPGLIVGRSSVSGRTTIEATLVPGVAASIWWATRENAALAIPREVRFLSDVKTLVSVTAAQLGIAALADITVVRGEPSQFEMGIPAGYEVTGATGASLESSEVQADVLILKVGSVAQRSYQFLVSMEKPISAAKADVLIPGFKGTQRETGEVLVEGQGAMELAATEKGGLKRMDLKETNPYLRSLAHDPVHTAFRYHRQPPEMPALSLEWVRYPDSNVLAAVAQEAVVTTLVTSEGRSLTEVRLVLRNQAQPFLKVALPAGASILSADVAGEKVKPVQGPDGNRVPLLRPGFRPRDSYTVSFVFMHSGAPFAKKGGSELTLPKMDVPIGLVQWEVFLAEQYKVKDFGGDAISAILLPPSVENEEGSFQVDRLGEGRRVDLDSLLPGQLGGAIVDVSGAVVPGAQVTVVHLQTGAITKVYTDPAGHWVVANIASGRIRITVESAGFVRLIRDVNYDARGPAVYNLTLQVGSVSQTVEVSSASSSKDVRLQIPRTDNAAKQKAAAGDTAASSNVMDLQKRVAGVLPIAVDVPRAGKSFRFVRPLVIDAETKLTFSYRTK
jgi:hypothetical protein